MAKKGRPKGARGKGYFFRSGRGWCDSNKRPLLGDDGLPIKDRHASTAAKRAYLRLLIAQPVRSGESITVLEACDRFLEYCQANNSASTYSIRKATLTNFCARYGKRLASEITKGDIDAWLTQNEGWDGSRGTHIRGVLRAFNYGVEAGYLKSNPIRGYPQPKSNARITYITPEQEEAIYSLASGALATAIRVCIRTGARPGCEFAKLTDRHITYTDRGMEWRFQPSESKTGKLRIIRVTDPNIIELCKAGKGVIFRSSDGNPWRRESLTNAFRRVRERLEESKTPLDEDCCMYSCRHTFAKRVLSGFWTGKPTTVEVLAGLMGNSRDICWKHYATWCDAYTDPLWNAV